MHQCKRTGQVWGRLTADYARHARSQRRVSAQEGGAVAPTCLTLTVPVLSGWRLPGA